MKKFLVLAFAIVNAAFAQSYINYQVTKGDTLFDLALRYGTTVNMLEQINSLSGSSIYVGQSLKIPSKKDTKPQLSSFVNKTTEHEVTADETIDAIAEHYGISTKAIIDSNSSLAKIIADSPLVVGMRILIPPAEGRLLKYQESDNLLSLALKNGLKPHELLDVNGLMGPEELEVGMTLFLPDASVLATINNPFIGVGGSDGGEAEKVEQNVGSSSNYIWPLSGRLTSGFGRRNISVNGNTFHRGIDIAAPIGTPIAASKSGQVYFADWSNTYGWVIFLNHYDGSQTRYAHMSKMAVQAGDYVEQGQVIGYVGTTGASTGPHLHFEIRINASAVNPIPLLP